MNKIFGTIIGVVGIAYGALEFVPSIEPPANMRLVFLAQQRHSEVGPRS